MTKIVQYLGITVHSAGKIKFLNIKAVSNVLWMISDITVKTLGSSALFP
jgi:hypothetical protein